jgi:hypothetical protein
MFTRFRKSHAKSLEVEIPISLRSRGRFRGDFRLESFTRFSFPRAENREGFLRGEQNH